MASSSPTEIESLRRQHNSLTFQLARVTREHELELCAKDKLRTSIVLNRDKRYKKTGAELAAVRSDRAGLKRSLDKTTHQLQAKTHEAVCLQQEVKTLCGKVDAATLRIKKLKKLLGKKTGSVSQGLRRKIKALCLKYHTDHRGVLSVSNEEVMRDLTELLAA